MSGAERPASPEEMQVYGELLGNSIAAIYSPETAQRVAMVFESPSPVEGLASVIASTLAHVATSGVENGMPISPEMAGAAALQLAEDLGTNLARATAARPLSEEQVEAVYLRSMELLAEQRDARAKGMQGPPGAGPGPGGGGPPMPGRGAPPQP